MLVVSACANFFLYQTTRGGFREDQAQVFWDQSWRFALVVLFYHYFWLFFLTHLAFAVFVGDEAIYYGALTAKMLLMLAAAVAGVIIARVLRAAPIRTAMH